MFKKLFGSSQDPSAASGQTPDREDEDGAPLSQAMVDVIEERSRQIRGEGFDQSHDDQHMNGALVFAANSYSFNALNPAGAQSSPPPGWPWAREWWKPKGPRRDLVRAAALLLAEIERLDRQEERKAKPAT